MIWKSYPEVIVEQIFVTNSCFSVWYTAQVKLSNSRIVQIDELFHVTIFAGCVTHKMTLTPFVKSSHGVRLPQLNDDNWKSAELFWSHLTRSPPWLAVKSIIQQTCTFPSSVIWTATYAKMSETGFFLQPQTCSCQKLTYDLQNFGPSPVWSQRISFGSLLLSSVFVHPADKETVTLAHLQGEKKTVDMEKSHKRASPSWPGVNFVGLL